MARVGRKRKQVSREANGKPQRATQAVLNEINQREAMKVKNVVLMQPHRRELKDPDSEHAECALGRFYLANGNKIALEAGRHYAGLVRRWRAAHGMASAHAPEESTGTGEGPAWSTVQGWLRDIRRIEAALDQAGPVIRFAVNRLVIEDRDPVDRQAALDALLGLRIVALESELLRPDHPFK